MLTPTQGGVQFYQHTQSTASSTWTINHNFGTIPLVDVNVWDGGILKKAFPQSVTHVNENSISITWSVPRTGYASVAAKQIV